MSNTKQVWIEGQMPFNIYEHDESAKWLGLMNSPSIGIRIGYSSSFMKPVGDRGGLLSMHYFTIQGQEAIRYESLFKMCNDFVAGGSVITKLMTKDLDDNGNWEDYLDKIHEPDASSVGEVVRYFSE